jgi:membrane-anchored protein YejM (alkaline phosphatase superfamily)
MPYNRSSFLRTVAASLLCLSGLGQIAALWLRELTAAALADALLGTVYLVISIGLFGLSRFSLVLAIVIPGAALSFILITSPQPEQVYILRMAIDAVVILFSSIALWKVRNNPSI